MFLHPECMRVHFTCKSIYFKALIVYLCFQNARGCILRALFNRNMYICTQNARECILHAQIIWFSSRIHESVFFMHILAQIMCSCTHNAWECISHARIIWFAPRMHKNTLQMQIDILSIKHVHLHQEYMRVNFTCKNNSICTLKCMGVHFTWTCGHKQCTFTPRVHKGSFYMQTRALHPRTLRRFVKYTNFQTHENTLKKLFP